MSRKSRTTTGRPSLLKDTAHTLRKRGGVAAITGGIVLLGGLILVVGLWFEPPGEPGEEAAPEPSGEVRPAIPTPDMNAMERPVRRRLERARKALEGHPDHGPAWGAYGALCDAHALYECAEVCYTQATKLDTADFRWPYLLGFVSELRGAPAERVAGYYETAARLEPKLPTTFYRLGEALTRAGRLDEAATAYGRAVEIDPEFVAAHRGLGQVALAQGDAPAAIVHLERAVALGAGGNSATLSSLAQAQLRAGDSARAEANAARAATATEEIPIPDPVRFRLRGMNLSSAESSARADRLIEAGRCEAALRQLSIVEESHPDAPSTHYRIGVCLARLGHREEALKRLERAALLAPEDETVRWELERVRALPD